MVWGLAPGETLKEDFTDDTDSDHGPPSPTTRELMNYLLYHPKVRFGRTLDARDRGALGKAMKRLADIYPTHEIHRAVDRFYMTRTAANHPRPVWAFCSYAFQDKLFEGATVDVQDSVLVYIANGFVRDVDLELPWDRSKDAEIGVEFILNPDYNVLVRTYPDVVSEILTHWHDDDWHSLMDAAFEHYEWILGVKDTPSARLSLMSEKFALPKDFLVRNRPRATQTRTAEAVRISRGR